MPVEWRGHTSVGKRAHGIRRAGSAVLRVLVVVEENAVTLLLPPLRTSQAGRRRSTSRDNASAALRTSSKAQRCWIRTLTCIPREPLVFAQPRSPISSRSDFTSRATRRTSRQLTPGPGSRSTRNSSGCSRSLERTGCGCSSMQPRLTIQASPAASSTTTSSALRPRE